MKGNNSLNVCPNCGAEVKNGSLFCDTCGTRLSGERDIPENIQNEVEQEQVEESNKEPAFKIPSLDDRKYKPEKLSSKEKKKLSIIAAIIILIVVCGVFFLNKFFVSERTAINWFEEAGYHLSGPMPSEYSKEWYDKILDKIDGLSPSFFERTDSYERMGYTSNYSYAETMISYYIGMWDDAKSAIKIAEKVDGKMLLAYSKSDIADALERSGKTNEAIIWYEKSIDAYSTELKFTNDKDSKAIKESRVLSLMIKVGDCYIKMNNKGEAKKCYEKAVDRIERFMIDNPNNNIILCEMCEEIAKAFDRCEESNLAVKWYEKTVNLLIEESDNTRKEQVEPKKRTERSIIDNMISIGKCYAKINDNESSNKWYQTALERLEKCKEEFPNDNYYFSSEEFDKLRDLIK